MARVVRLGMDFGSDLLEHEHDLVASNNGEEVRPGPVTASLVANVESQLGLVERNRGAQVVVFTLTWIFPSQVLGRTMMLVSI